jgi:ubiquinone/menaquinone biosynthesis C-methylase UbiE
MCVQCTAHEIQRKYDRFARWYDLSDIVLVVLGVPALRRALLRRASGRTLEVAVGTGRNLPLYPGDCQITAVDLSPGMLEIARRRAARAGRPVAFARMDAEALAFPDRSFDTVVSTLSTCTFLHPVAALREMSRVCRPGGRILLLEHGRSDREWLGRWQDRTAERHARQLGCHWNRRPDDLVQQAGLSVLAARRRLLGIFQALEAAPARRVAAGAGARIEAPSGGTP